MFHEVCFSKCVLSFHGKFFPFYESISSKRNKDADFHTFLYGKTIDQVLLMNRYVIRYDSRNDNRYDSRYVTAFASIKSRLKPKKCAKGDFNGFSINQSGGISNWYPLDYAIEISCSYVRIGANILCINWLMSTLINMPSGNLWDANHAEHQSNKRWLHFQQMHWISLKVWQTEFNRVSTTHSKCQH